MQNEFLREETTKRNKEVANALTDEDKRDFLHEFPDSMLFKELIRRNNVKNNFLNSVKNAIVELEENL